jgi:RHS repeat-associated protein
MQQAVNSMSGGEAMNQGYAISRRACVLATLITAGGMTINCGVTDGSGPQTNVAAVTATDILVPPQGYVWYAPLFVPAPPSNADELGNLPGPPWYPTPLEAGLTYCRQANPTYTAQVLCGPGQQFPCGFACFDQNGTFAGGTVLDEAAICPFASIPEFTSVDGVANIVCRITGIVIPKNTGRPDCDTTGCTDPIHLGTGNSYQSELDYVGSGIFPLRFERYYNSNGSATQNDIHFSDTGGEVQSYLSTRWKHSYGRSIVVHRRTPSLARAVRPDGRQLFFHRAGGVFLPDADGIDQLDRLTDSAGNLTGWRLTVSGDDSVELYNALGRLISITNRAGLQQTLAYDANGRLTSVTDPFGAALSFGYNASGQLVTLTDPAGQVYTYAYDTRRRLVSVTYPNTQARAYLYENAGFAEGLTAIIDENGARFASWTYDSHGRAISSEHAGGVDRVTAADPAHVIDAFNNTRSLNLQTILGVSKTTAVTGPACPACGPAAQSFDANGNTTSRTDWNGNRTSYTYDQTRNLETSRTEGLTASGGATPQTRTISTQWHASFRMPTSVAEPLRITTSIYDDDGTQCGARGALCSKTTQATTDTNGSQGFAATPTGSPRTWTYTYNASGRVLTVDGPRSDVADTTSHTYYASSDPDLGKRGNLATITDAAGNVTQFTAYNAHGQPLTVIDPNGLTTAMTYDARQRITSRTVGGETTTYDHDAAGQLTRVAMPDGSFLSFGYDPAHRLISLQDNLGNRVAYTLDAMGNRTQEQVFDPNNRIAQTHSREYSNLNRLFHEVGAIGQTTEYTYDNQGNVTTIKDSLENVTARQYDPLDRLKQTTDPLGGAVQYVYNGIDTLTQVTDPRNLATSYASDGLGNVNQQVSPDTGTTTSGHDEAGNVVAQTDGEGQQTAYAYDALNRITLVTFDDGSTQSYVYDQGPNSLRRLSSIIETDPTNQVTGVIAFAYEQHGRVTSETRTIGSTQYVVGYSYDSAGRLSGMTYPSGRTVAYGFDAAGRIHSIDTTVDGQTTSVVHELTYHPFGGVTGFTLGNGQTYARSYDLDGRIVSYTLGAQAFAIGYDAAGRIISISDAADPAATNSYSYDDIARLTSTVLPSSSFAYTYDAVGNRTSRTTDSITETYEYATSSNRLSRISSPTTERPFTFDANGSTVDDGRNTYAYDARGRLVQATSSGGTSTYQINALGQRVAKTAPDPSGVTTLFADGFSGPTGRPIDDQSDGLWKGGRAAILATVNAAGQAEIAAGRHIQTVSTFALPSQGLTLQATLTRGRLSLLRAGQNEGVIVRYAGDQVAVARAKDDDGDDVTSDTNVRQRFQVSPPSTPLTVTIDLRPGSARVRIASETTTFDTGDVELSNVIAGEPYRIRLGAVKLAGVPVTGIVDDILLSGGSPGASRTTHFIYDTTGKLIAEADASGAVRREYIYLGDTPVMMFGPSAATSDSYFIHTDHLDTPRLIADGSRQPVWRWDVKEPFGVNSPEQNLSVASGFEFAFRFPGQYFDKEVGVSYNSMRDYDSSIGRYLQADPIGLVGGMNPYSYVGGNPMTYSDPNGLVAYSCTKPLDVITKIFGSKVAEFAYWYLPYMYHQYSCVYRDGEITCGGQDYSSSPISSPGKPTNDTYNDDRCVISVPDDSCFDDCLREEWEQPRPRYGIPFGVDCHEYDDDVNSRCRKRCGLE